MFRGLPILLISNCFSCVLWRIFIAGIFFINFTAALQSVFPQTELGTFMSLIKRDKERQLNELTLIVTGIRLFNRECGKGGEGIDDCKLKWINYADRKGFVFWHKQMFFLAVTSRKVDNIHQANILLVLAFLPFSFGQKFSFTSCLQVAMDAISFSSL